MYAAELPVVMGNSSIEHWIVNQNNLINALGDVMEKRSREKRNERDNWVGPQVGHTSTSVINSSLIKTH